MTTYFLYEPLPSAPFQFQPTLDGQVFIASVTWNLFGNRNFLNINDTGGGLVLSRALISSPDGFEVQAISWDHGTVTLKTEAVHDYVVLGTFPLTVRGFLPEAYNGTFQCFVIDKQTIRYVLPSDPGPVQQYGSVANDINLIKYYFNTSSLVYRESSRQFEVTP